MRFFDCREIITLDISSTVVDESKEIVLIEFASSSSIIPLRMTCMSVRESVCDHSRIVYSERDRGGLSRPRLLRRGQVFPS